MTIDIHRLCSDRRALDERIRRAKSALRSRWTRPMADVQHELLALKHEATELCVLRAALRGRLHLPDPELCQRIAAARAPEYAVEAA